jgi:ribosome-associated protein
LTSQELARLGAELALTKKAKDVCILDLRELTDMTDFFLVCSGDSDTQVKAISDAIMMGIKESGQQIYRKEGHTKNQWVLIDLVDVVVHVFQPQIREYYNIERLWGDAKVERIEE